MTPTNCAPTLAVVGCGAIAEAFHLPALARHKDVLRKLILVDRDLARARRVAGRFGVGRVENDLNTVLSEIQGAVVAVPHRFHHPIGLTLLGAGVHVLCEKPLAESFDEAEALVAAGDRHGARLAVNYQRRAYPTCQEIHRLIRDRTIGDLVSIEISWGERFDWAAASGFYFGNLGSGRGALLDRGAHALDLICWWMGERPRVTRAEDDSFGGSEATVLIEMEATGVRARLELSWLSPYPNRITVTGSQGVAEAGIYDFKELRVAPAGGKPRSVRLPSSATTSDQIGQVIIDNFVEVVQGTSEPLVPGSAVLDSVTLTDAYYEVRHRMTLPWHAAYRRAIGV